MEPSAVPQHAKTEYDHIGIKCIEKTAWQPPEVNSRATE
jgi:hypothetical protein